MEKDNSNDVTANYYKLLEEYYKLNDSKPITLEELKNIQKEVPCDYDDVEEK